MSRPSSLQGAVKVNGRAAGSARRRGFLRLFLETLEDRLMLDAAPDIVVGRTLSAYYVGQIQNHQETITYTVYNEQADPETGVLLTTTLQNGVTVASASQPPDQSGRDLAWSLGTIPGYGRTSVALTVNLASPTPTQLDSGAHAYATLDAGAVSASTPAATLRAGNLSDSSLLASTPDANTTDPFIQEEAARLQYDPNEIFNFLHTQIGYNAYTGSVRGARGTLWSSAGNALDVASLGVALMRASGIPAQYAQGTLSQSQAAALILSMFPASYQTVGYLPAGTLTSDPANDPHLLSETESHDWFQFDAGGGMQAADPLMAGAAVGHAFTATSGTFTVVPDSLREKTEIQVVAEITGTAASLFGLGGQSNATVIDQTFNDVDLVGRPVTLGFNTSTSSGGFLFTTTTNTYSPFLAWGDDAYDSTHDQIITGKDFQEILTNFPFGSSLLTGVFLNVVERGPQGPALTTTRTLFDRIGYAARQGAASTSLSVAPGSAPAFSNYDAFTLDLSAAADDPHPNAALDSQIQADAAQLAARQASTDLAATAQPFARGFDIDLSRGLGNNFLTLSQLHTATLASAAGVAAYFARPRVVLISQRFVAGSTTTPSSLTSAIDILADAMRIEGAPGQSIAAPYLFNTTRGMFDNMTERDVVAALAPSGQARQVDNTFDVFQAAVAQGIGFTAISSANLADLSRLDIPGDARARITTDVNQGFGVVVPDRAVMLNGTPTIAWAEINLATGEYIGVDANGGHQGAFEFLALAGEQLEFQLQVIKFFSPVAGIDAGGFLGVAFQLNAAAGDRNEAAAALKEQKDKTEELYKDLVEKGELLAMFLQEGLTDEVIAKLAGVEPPSIEDTVRKALGLADNAFAAALDATVFRLTGADPAVTSILSNPMPLTALPANQATATVSANAASGLTAGSLQGTVQVPSVSATGPLAAAWSSTAKSSFQATALSASGATVVDANGTRLGTGTIALAAASAVPVAVSGNDQYSVKGAGTLAFYGPAETRLGVGGDWSSYAATVTGNASITLTTDALSLNGQALPAGTYTITVGSATISGSGTTSSPTFSGLAAITATNGTINLGPGSGTLSVAGKPLDPKNETTLDGYSGTLSVSANGNGADSVALNGTAGRVLQVTASLSKLTTDQNTPVTFAANVQTSLADTYTLTANAPPGWTVAIDSKGNITATPASGLQGGTYPIRIIARSQTDANLVAQTTVAVTITPTQPGINFAVAPDPQFTVPYNGAQLPTAFRASIQDLGPAADTFTLTAANLPTGFSLQQSGTTVTVPAGQTGIAGLYLVPNPGQPLPAPGTQLTFDVTATSTTNPALTKTVTETFTVPAIDGITLTSNPRSVASTPGSPATTILTLTNVGNVPEDVTLAATLPNGLTASGLSTATLQPGGSTTETVTLTPSAATAPNTTLNATFTASYGPAATPQTAATQASLVVRSAQVLAVQRAASAASGLTNSQAGANLAELADALAQLQTTPTDATTLNRVQFLLGNLNALVQADPALASFVSQLQPLIASANAGDTTTLFAQAGTFFNSLAAVLAQEAGQQFTASLSPGDADLAPGQGKTFTLTLTSQSSAPETLNLTLGTLPAGVTASLGQAQVTLAPGQTTTVPVTLSQTIASTRVFTLPVMADAGLVQHQATAVVAVRPAAADVLGVTTTPGTANPGTPITLTAQVFNTANAARTLLAHVDLLDSAGNVLKTLSDMPVTLSPGAGPLTLNLPPVDSTGLGVGVYYVRVSLLGADGGPIPGHTAQASFLVGVSVEATVASSATVVPLGTSQVTTTISVTGDNTVGPPPRHQQ